MDVQNMDMDDLVAACYASGYGRQHTVEYFASIGRDDDADKIGESWDQIANAIRTMNKD